MPCAGPQSRWSHGYSFVGVTFYMKNTPSYNDQIKSPKWQKKRLEILARDKWRCQICWNDKLQLVVHHKYYTKGQLIHEYPNICYITLCVRCHEKIHGKVEVKQIQVPEPEPVVIPIFSPIPDTPVTVSMHSIRDLMKQGSTPPKHD